MSGRNSRIGLTPLSLAEGRAGQAAALCLTVAGVLVVWLGVIAPGLSWYHARNRRIAESSLLLQHERALVMTLPRLRAGIAALNAPATGVPMLIRGGSDAVAGARLQGAVQSLARRDSISLDSAETLAPVQTGRFRRIPLRVTMITPYRRLAVLLAAIAAAQPGMLVDDLAIHGTGVPSLERDVPVRARFTVSAFWAARKGEK